ncbi:helix-turn-helix transcriptional regulator [Kitasatospora sp. NBC_01287]|uniref:helix-turn-helix domain-containing protein n=1 Tax=Kitasatospora sp. NBC_01287 TaxID=2903573 RepID=UPI00338E171C
MAKDDQPEWVRQHRREVGERIGQARRRRGLTQEQLAEQLSVDSKTISRAENGWHSIGLDLVAWIAHALEVPSGDLLPRDRPPGPAGG